MAGVAQAPVSMEKSAEGGEELSTGNSQHDPQPVVSALESVGRADTSNTSDTADPTVDLIDTADTCTGGKDKGTTVEGISDINPDLSMHDARPGRTDTNEGAPNRDTDMIGTSPCEQDKMDDISASNEGEKNHENIDHKDTTNTLCDQEKMDDIISGDLETINNLQEITSATINEAVRDSTTDAVVRNSDGQGKTNDSFDSSDQGNDMTCVVDQDMIDATADYVYQGKSSGADVDSSGLAESNVESGRASLEASDPGMVNLDTDDPCRANLDTVDSARDNLETDNANLDTVDSARDNLETVDTDNANLDCGDPGKHSVDTSDSSRANLDTVDSAKDNLDSDNANFKSGDPDKDTVDTSDSERSKLETVVPEKDNIDHSDPSKTDLDGRDPSMSNRKDEIPSDRSTEAKVETTDESLEGTGAADKEVGVASRGSTPSIYLSDSEEKEKPEPQPEVTKRLTRAQKAAMEALASFGGSSFDSMSVKKVDLRIKLKREADQRKRREEGGGEEPQAKRPRTRLQRAVAESEVIHRHTALGEDVKKKYPKITMAKLACRKTPPKKEEEGLGYCSRVERSRKAAIETFDGASLSELPVKRTVKLQSAHVKARKYTLKATDKIPRSKKSKSKSPTSPVPPDPPHRETRAERARREAIMSFGGNTLDNVLETSKKKVARTLTSSRPAASRSRGKKREREVAGMTVEAGEGEGTDAEAEAMEVQEPAGESCDVTGSLSRGRRKEKENLRGTEEGGRSSTGIA